MKNNNYFDMNSFISPDVSYAPVYIWVWNDICTREIIDAQIAEMQNLGIRAFYILPEPEEFRPNSMPTKLEPEYLSDEYAELCLYAFEKAKSLGMNCWIYDEGGWPSGSACGKVMKDHPEFGRETLAWHELSFARGEVYKKSDTDILAGFINNEIIEDGYIFLDDSVVTEYFIKKDIFGSYPDLMNKEATEYFIETTHKKYKLCDNVTAVFTDEPKAPAGAFNKELEKKYEALYGESILPFLPLLAKKVAVTQENVHILHRYFDLCSRAFCENFLLPCKKWANENGLAFTGHMDKDHNPLGCMNGGGNFNLMRALRCLDIPGVDVIWRQLYPENQLTDRNEMNGYNGFFPRYASSAAAQKSAKLAMCEIFGVAGAAITYDIMRYTVGYLAVRGINIFNLFNFSLGRNGRFLAQELPVYTESQPYYHFLGQFNKYMERLSYAASLGERVCETALYYPVSDFQGYLNAETTAKEFDALGRALEDKMVDFDISDDDVIQSAEHKDGCLCIGNAKYRHIIIPEGAFIPQKTQIALDEFTRNGGKVSYSINDAVPVIATEGKGLRAMHRKTENAEIYCLFRECGENEEYKLHLPSTDGYLLNLQNGEAQKLCAENGICNISLAVGETAVILLTDEELSVQNKNEFGTEYVIPDNFNFSRQTELICDENGFDNVKHHENTVSVTLGDWAETVGKEFSGSCVYETMFSLPDEKAGKSGKLNLGEVHFAASVYINNSFVGTALTTPYCVEIPEGILEKNNKLRIVVTNTSANWYLHTDYFNKWKTEELSPYFEPELKFAKDFVSGGLYGPVKLYTE
ncbi:MAG: hypothetical protein J6Q94_02185 [Clostridia bacterium]|nr:hypothetical protein [Clostridia bacterium]